jgi:hypothetical protein
MARYLVSSNAAGYGGLFLFDTTDGSIRQLLRGSYRGVTRGPDGAWYTVSGRRNPRKDTSTVHRLDPETWKAEAVAEHPVKDSHDLKWIRGAFYLAASVGNQVLKLDADCRLIDRLQLVSDDRDTCHVNCLVDWQDALYCTVFTLTAGSRLEKRLLDEWHTDGKLLKLDFESKTFEVACEPLGQPHSLVGRGGMLYVLESHTSSVTRLDPRTGSRERVAQYSGFLRGLAFTPGEAVVGVCEMYAPERKKLRPLPFFRQWLERVRPFSGLLVLDERWKVRRRVPLPGAEVYDVVSLGSTG